MIEAIPDGVNIFPLNARLEYYHNCSKIGYLELTKFYYENYFRNKKIRNRKK